MAKFTPGPMVAAVSRSQGGTVFSRNRGGAYTRNRSVPITSTSPAALAAKSRLATASQAWQGLTTAQRDSWKAWALQNPVIDTLGAQRILSGAQAYNQINARRAAAGDAALTDPPVGTSPAGLTALSLTADIGLGNFEITYTPTPLGATEEVYLFGATVNSAGISYISNQLRFLGVSAAAAASPLDIETLYTNRLGIPPVGAIAHVQAAVYDNATGLVSRPLRAFATVVST